MLEKMLFYIPPVDHEEDALQQRLSEHPEIKFVSLVGVDIFGQDTDEKIPVRNVMSDYQGFLEKGVQTDGSSVLLPGIADLSNARVDLIPDADSVWYIDYNFANIDELTGLPVGTLRIPATLLHNSVNEVGSRVILRDAEKAVKKGVVDAMRDNPYVFKYLPFDSVDEIDEILLTSATEMEFYVKTPHEMADKERLHTSQELKESYWKRTIGPVRTALEKTIEILDYYGLEVEMGHKEVGGVKAELTTDGFTHIMEQLEIDWRFDSPMGAADKDYLARSIIKDTFRRGGLDVTFMAKPVEGVAGSGKHTHFGIAARLKDGRKVNLFTATDPSTDYMSPIGFGAIMGLLKNYEIINPLANCTNDALNRLKPGFEAPVSIVTSIGRSVDVTSRNRTVLACLVRDFRNPMATRFEMRSPNPKSNSYLVMGAGFLAMLDGIKAVLAAGKTPAELCESISKPYGAEDFYLEKNRVYRAENNIFEDYSEKEREKYFGKTPATVWENLTAFDEYPEKTRILFTDDVMTPVDLESFRQSVLKIWSTELHDRIIPSLEGSASKDALKRLAVTLEERRYSDASELLKKIR